MWNNEGFVVLPDLPGTPSAPRRAAWAKVTAAGLHVKHVYPASQKHAAYQAALLCSKASGVDFIVSECLY